MSRRSLLLVAMAVLLFADGALVGVVLSRKRAVVDNAPTERAGIDWTRLTPTDLRIASVFGVLERQGLGASLDALDRAGAEDSMVLRDGHQLAHALGRLAVAEHHGDASVIRECRSTMASGCYHGVVEAFVQSHGRVDMAELQRVCVGAGAADQPGPVYECVHGLGHGVLGAVANVNTALHDCDALSGGFDTWCHAGVFMEAMRWAVGESRPDLPAAHEHHHGAAEPEHHHGGSLASQLPINPADPYSPCDRFAERYGAACWIFQGYIILRDRGFDPALALQACDRAPRGWVIPCYQSIGLQITGLFQRDDGWIIEQCAHGNSELAPQCAAGAARALAQIDWSGARSARFCAASPVAWKDACYRTTGYFLTTLASSGERAKLCARVEPAYVETCRRGASRERGS